MKRWDKKVCNQGGHKVQVQTLAESRLGDVTRTANVQQQLIVHRGQSERAAQRIPQCDHIDFISRMIKMFLL